MKKKKSILVVTNLLLNIIIKPIGIPDSIVLHDAQETVDAISAIICAKNKGAYLRFGSDDIALAIKKSGQAKEMQEAMALHGPTILKTFPFEFFGWDAGNIARLMPFWKGSISDIYTPSAVHFLAINNQDKCIQFLQNIKKQRCLFIGNAAIPKSVRAALCGAQCTFIPVVGDNAYAQIDALEKECLRAIDRDKTYTVIITAIGSSGPILQKRLWHKLSNIFLFDMDSFLQALCGCPLQGWTKHMTINAQKYIELLSAQTHILCTTALINRNTHDFNQRKQEYSASFQKLATYGYPIIHIVEALAERGPTFLNDYSTHVCYSKVNNPKLDNKGVNEAQSMLASFKQFDFKDNDMIVKLTGRYIMTSDKFLRCIEAHPSYDAFVNIAGDGSVFTGCFAMRYKYFKVMLEQLDFDAMEKQSMPIEWLVFDYIKESMNNKSMKVMCLDSLDVRANINFPPPGYTTMYF